MRRTRHITSALATAVLAMAAAGCGGIMNHGSTSPSSVEKKGHTLTQQTLDAIRPALGSAGTSVDRAGWHKCDTETPGQHRFEYTSTLRVDVPEAQSEQVIAAARAHFEKEGYSLDAPDPQGAQVAATDKNSPWRVGVGVNNDKKSMFLSVDSGCVGVSHDPKTT